MDDAKPMHGTAYPRNSVSAAEWAVRVDLAAAHRMAEINGWTDLIFNHLTARVPDQPSHFLIKPHELMFEEVTASNLIRVDQDGAPVDRDQGVNAAGFTIHSAVYRARPDVNAVMHVHSDPGVAIAALKGGLRCLCQEAMTFYNRVGYHDFEGIALDIGERERLAANLGPHKTLILRNHGVLTCSDTVADAALRLRSLIMAAETQLRILAAGEELNEPLPEVCERTARQFEALAAKHARRDEWQAMLRWLDRKDPSYRD
ncbi:MAG TPA: class II aldolase/adducin family protein [Stellaceae bacterium]|nr:class II aldolase/adducin family protein [Stellaceae bacterium]